MVLNQVNLILIIDEYKTTREVKPLLLFLKGIFDQREAISLDINDSYHQFLFQTLVEILNKYIPKEENDTDLLEIICDMITQQVTLIHIRWYLIYKCHALEILTEKFLSFSYELLQIKIAKTILTFLIHSQDDESKSSLNQDLVSKLFKKLITIIRGDFSQEYNEVSLGLLASICQIWTGCPKVMNVIDDYLVLRKQLLRFLSAEMVKRTTIVNTMTIMFHLCNSDDRLFNKRNIRQTLQVLFNIMLNCDTEWASLYAARLLTEICKSPKTCHLLSEYKSLAASLRNSISQITERDKIIISKHLEFILVVTRTSSEYRRIMLEIILSPMEYERSCHGNDENVVTDVMSILINHINDPDNTISIYSIRILNEIYLELIGSNNVVKLPHLNNVAEAINHLLFSSSCNILLTNSIPNSVDDQDSAVLYINQHILHRDNLSTLTKIKYLIQLITNLLTSGDQWLDQIPTFLKDTDRFITEQINSNPLNNETSLLDHDILLPILFIGVEVFIDMLYFYYRATEKRPSSSLFGERLKFYLEQSKCPIMLAFSLSAATQNQMTLQRALVLQGVCLHLQDFNVELMGEKMYQFSSDFAALKFQIPSLDKYLKDQILLSERNNVAIAEVANGDSEFLQNNRYNVHKNHSFETYDTSALQSTVLISKTKHMNEHMTNQNSAEIEITKCNSSKLKRSNLVITQTSFCDVSGIQTDKVNLDQRVQEIVKKWTDFPEISFTSNEIYSIFEYRIQSMQSQDALMEEVIANKTAALHQSEALLNQYRKKLNSIEKESNQIRFVHVEQESLCESLKKEIKESDEKIKSLEIANRKLTELNVMNDKHKDECLVISKKLQERLLKVSEEKSKLQCSLQSYISQIENYQNIISDKESQINNYIQVTKLINKLTGNKFPMEKNAKINLEDLNKSLKSPIQSEYDCNSSSNLSKMTQE